MRDFTVLIRRDQRVLCFAVRAYGRPFSPARPCPFRFAKPALVTNGNGLAASAAGFRLRLGGGVALRSRRHSVCAPLSPLADDRPKPCQNAFRYKMTANKDKKQLIC
jgi:hypothetical protein